MIVDLAATFILVVGIVMLITALVRLTEPLEEADRSLMAESRTETRALEYKVDRFRHKQVNEPVQVVYLCASDIRHEIGFVRLHDPDFDDKHAALVVLAEDRIATLQAHAIAA